MAAMFVTVMILITESLCDCCPGNSSFPKPSYKMIHFLNKNTGVAVIH